MDADMFQCQHCQESYTADGPNPIMPILLDCGHDICLDCSKKVLCNKGVLNCPNCLQKHERFPLDSLPFIWSLIRRNANILTSGNAQPSSHSKMTLHVVFSTGSGISCDVTPTITIMQLRQLLTKKYGISFFEDRIMYGGLQLIDEETLSFYDITDKSKIYMIKRLLGD